MGISSCRLTVAPVSYVTCDSHLRVPRTIRAWLLCRRCGHPAGGKQQSIPHWRGDSHFSSPLVGGTACASGSRTHPTADGPLALPGRCSFRTGVCRSYTCWSSGLEQWPSKWREIMQGTVARPLCGRRGRCTGRVGRIGLMAGDRSILESVWSDNPWRWRLRNALRKLLAPLCP